MQATQAKFKGSLVGTAGQGNQLPVAQSGNTPYANIPARPGDKENRQRLLGLGARSIADMFYPESRFGGGNSFFVRY